MQSLATFKSFRILKKIPQHARPTGHRTLQIMLPLKVTTRNLEVLLIKFHDSSDDYTLKAKRPLLVTVDAVVTPRWLQQWGGVSLPFLSKGGARINKNWKFLAVS